MTNATKTVAELRIADRVWNGHLRTVHIVFPGRVSGTSTVHFTDGSFDVWADDRLVDVIDAAACRCGSADPSPYHLTPNGAPCYEWRRS
jgi:hypothetical protein